METLHLICKVLYDLTLISYFFSTGGFMLWPTELSAIPQTCHGLLCLSVFSPAARLPGMHFPLFAV